MSNEGVGARTTVRTSLVAVVASVVVGALAGLLWSILAPTEQFVVVVPGQGAALTGESLHRFDSLALFGCISFVCGVLLPVAFWTRKAARGPVLFLAMLAGAVLGALAMLGVGVWVAGLLHARPQDPAVGSVVEVAPGIGSLLALVIQPLVTSLVVVLLAAMNPHDNLMYTPVDESIEPDDVALEKDHA
ncbi:DUF2567 domain-containing protein [Rhodococcus sp. Eu-32]|uniref:DUF2567 domain-containing protein n=1 Tax=Rhodococcus sp. Eu-32 TaxID=1017319 RepID=UPI000DF3942D|nr:DUF2567 domain-containing protein [Rhodococcus sp. Eu-32]RRQ27647.1 DUF2567 domain-containing protein [Rhodococcus sp. Eu-32]